VRLRHILTSRTAHRDVQSQGRSTYLLLLRIIAHLGFTNPWQAAKREAVRVASCLPAQKAIWLAGLRRLAIRVTLQMVTCGFTHQVASGHGS